jgi:hypothetical protein
MRDIAALRLLFVVYWQQADARKEKAMYAREEQEPAVSALREAYERARKLPRERQEALAKLILREMEGWQWEEPQRTDATLRRALDLAGAWGDIPWESMEQELDRIDQESRPTPPIEL